jgi:nucleoside-diphosphate-sugar epimerase
MRIVILGGTGHVGTYLIPRLVDEGHQVVCVSRGQRQPYQPNRAWDRVETAQIDRAASEAQGIFGEQIAALRPDVVIDMICFTADSARQLVTGLRGKIQHFLHCGTIWVYGPSAVVPTSEDQPRRPFGEYGIQKAAIEAYLLDEARRGGFPATVLHPGHIVGPGWIPLNPAGNFNPVVFKRLAHAEPVALPNLGMETVHHVHADDVAQAFCQALNHRSTAIGENFHVVSPAAITLRGYAEAVAAWFGKTADLEFLSWDYFRKSTHYSDEDVQATWDHIAHSPNCSITKARQNIQYQPRYTSLQAVYESLQWLIQQGSIQV